jgi:hypothetical protein
MNEKIEQKEKKGEVYQAGGHGGVVITSPGIIESNFFSYIFLLILIELIL